MTTAGRPTLRAVYLGEVPYGAALELQRDAARRRISGELAQDLLLLLQHPHVITLGRSFKKENLVASQAEIERRGVELFDVERGGDVTYHGPGQLVGYPIFDLKRHKQDLHWYLRQVEESLIVALGELGISGGREKGYTGVWVEGLGGWEVGKLGRADGERLGGWEVGRLGKTRGETLGGWEVGRLESAEMEPSGSGGSLGKRKIASIGVHARDWVTWHGFALNVTTDLSFFELMVPCGISQVDMTSVARERPELVVGVEEVAEVVSRSFGRVFEHEPGVINLEFAHDSGFLSASEFWRRMDGSD